MASSISTGMMAFLLFISSFQILTVVSIDFQVGGNKGWVVPPSKDDQLYDEWASNNRFNINDTLHFSYKKDSVLEVTKEEYEKCRSVHPLFFSNNGNTPFTFDRSGLFYFISGVSGHCERGMKMVIKVLEPESTPPQPANQSANSSTSSASSLKMVVGAPSSSPTLVMLIVSFFSALLM